MFVCMCEKEREKFYYFLCDIYSLLNVYDEHEILYFFFLCEKFSGNSESVLHLAANQFRLVQNCASLRCNESHVHSRSTVFHVCNIKSLSQRHIITYIKRVWSVALIIRIINN